MVDKEKETTVFDVALASAENAFDVLMELNISCSELPKKDILSKSDPMVVVYVRDRETETSGLEPGKYGKTKWIEVGRTEAISNSRAPVFAKTIPIRYVFEEVQLLRFLVVDVDQKGAEEADFMDKTATDNLGIMKVTLSEIVRAPGSSVVRQISNKRKPDQFIAGKIKVTASEVSTHNRFVHLSLRASNLDKKDTFGLSDPYLVLYRAEDRENENIKSYFPVHKTEIIKKDLNPTWNPFTVSLNKWCKNDPKWPLAIECYDWDAEGSHDLIGVIRTTYGELLNKKEFDIVHPDNAKKGGNYQNSGVLHVVNIQEFKLPSFIDYITGGTEVCLVVAIDYTASNGDITEKGSLHYQDEQGPIVNPYVKAITAVGEVLAPYDSDKLYPAFGFGAKLVSLQNRTSHCFPINYNEKDPNCDGIEGILEAYVNSFDDLTLAGPTYFGPIIGEVVSMAEQAQKTPGSKYFLLLIITDGEVQDIEETQNMINKACNLPISIIIVGVGSNDFAKMIELDADQKVTKKLAEGIKQKAREQREAEANKKQQQVFRDPKKEAKAKAIAQAKAEQLKKSDTESNENHSRSGADSLIKPLDRDIVQFVPFKFFEDKPYYQLAKHTLAEVPRQFLEFMSKHKIAPLKLSDKTIGQKDLLIF